jgi:thioredoxin-related protein
LILTNKKSGLSPLFLFVNIKKNNFVYMKIFIVWLFSIGLVQAQNTNNLSDITIETMAGKAYQIDPKASNKTAVILFLSPECPLCESYTLTIRNLFQTYQKANFSFFIIIPGKTFSKQKISAFRKKYKLEEIPFYLDTKLELATFIQASITPEVAVFTPNNVKVYQGRIDNWAYELSKKRKVITEHDLANVLENIYQGQSVKPYKTKAIGCYIN